MTPAANEPATFRFVAQHLNHCATAVPHSVSKQTKNLNKTYNSKWITKGIKFSGKRMHFFFEFSEKEILCFKRSTSLYKKIPYHTQKVLKEAKKELMTGILKRQQTKQKIWQLINKQDGKCASLDKKIELKTLTGIVKNLQKVAQMLNAYFVETVEEIIKQNNYPSNAQTAQSKIEYCPDSIFVLPITENEGECVIKKFKGTFSAGYHEIPDM